MYIYIYIYRWHIGFRVENKGIDHYIGIFWGLHSLIPANHQFVLCDVECRVWRVSGIGLTRKNGFRV